MDLRSKIQQDINKALKEKDKEKLLLLRYLFSQIKDEEINKAREKLKNKAIIKLISKQIKKLEESLALFARAKRKDLISRTKKEIKALKAYLPQQLSEAELKKEIKKIIKENKKISHPGQLIGIAIKALAGKADNKKISEEVIKQTNA